MNQKDSSKIAPEIAAIGTVHSVLAKLEPEAQTRVLNYVAKMLRIRPIIQDEDTSAQREEHDQEEVRDLTKREAYAGEAEPVEDEIEGISPIAKKWMVRNGLAADQLSAIFSLGVDEIDLIARKVPGKSKKEKVRSVILLKGVAAYLGTGAARFTHEQLKETCLHYDAYDATNFSKYLKRLASEVSGNKSSGYTLTSRGIANATDLIKATTQPGTKT